MRCYGDGDREWVRKWGSVDERERLRWKWGKEKRKMGVRGVYI